MKKYLSMFIVIFILSSLLPTMAFAADGGYTSKGVFTSGIDVGSADVKCEDVAEQVGGASTNTELSGLTPEDTADKDNKFLQIMLGPIYRIIGDMFGGDGKEGIVGSCTEEFSLTKHIMKITSPVKVTDFQPLMTFMKYIQGIVFCFVILFIVQYGFQYTMGNTDIPDPMRFAYKMGLAIFGVMYAPYLIQDLLNLNNIVVYYISSIPIPSSTAGAITAGGAALGVAGSMAIANFLTIFATSIASGVGLFLLILALVLLIMILIPLIKIMVWWYIRLFTILLYTLFSPIFFLMTASETTEKYSKKFFMTFIAEIFSQIFVTIGFYFAIMLIMNFDTLSTTFDLGFIGLMLFLWVIVQLLSELPSWVKGWIGGSDAPGYRQMTSMVSAGIGQAVGNTFDKSLKKFNEKSAQSKFKKSNDNQHAAISSALNNNQAWSEMNDSEVKADKVKRNFANFNQQSQPKEGNVLEKLRNQQKTQSTNQQANPQGGSQGGPQTKQSGQPIMGITPPNASNRRKGNGVNASQLMGQANNEAWKQAKNDDVAFNMQPSDLSRNNNDTKRSVVQEADNSKSTWKDGAMDAQFSDVQDNGERKQIFSDETMSHVQRGLENGTLHRSEAVKAFADDLVSNRGMSERQAQSMAESRMQHFEANNALGLGFEAQSQINKLAKNGDLNQKNLEDIIKKDAVYNKGMKNKDDVDRHVHNAMSKGNFEELVGQKSNRESAAVQRTPGMNLGNKIRTSGGIKEGAKATTGERKAANYEIPANSRSEYDHHESIADTVNSLSSRTLEPIEQEQSVQQNDMLEEFERDAEMKKEVKKQIERQQEASPKVIDASYEVVEDKGDDINPAHSDVGSAHIASSSSGNERTEKSKKDGSSPKTEPTTEPTQPRRESNQTKPNGKTESTSEQTQPRRESNQTKANDKTEPTSKQTQPRRESNRTNPNGKTESTTKQTQPRRESNQTKPNDKNEKNKPQPKDKGQ